MLTLGLTILLTGCQPPSPPDWPLMLTGQLRSIKSVQTQRPVGSTVYVRGTVGDRVPLVKGQVYELTDSTGSIWVVTNDVTTETGEALRVRGKVSYEATPEFGNDSGEVYLWEIQKVTAE